MAQIKYDLQDLYKQAFGITLPEYKLDANANDLPVSKEDGALQGIYGSPQYQFNPVTGSYYFMPVFLDVGKNSIINDKDYELPFPIVRLQSQKKIVETPLTDRKGTVVEMIHQESWKIYIKGFIIAETLAYPEQAILDLKNIYELNESLQIRSMLTDLFLTANDRVVITDLNFPEVKGLEGVKPYELNLISTNVFDLVIKE